MSYVNTRDGRYAADLGRPSSIQVNCVTQRKEHFRQYGNWINTPMRIAFMLDRGGGRPLPTKAWVTQAAPTSP
jgi:hypothetical protein